MKRLSIWLAGRGGRWKEESMRAIAAHFEPVCAKSGISEDELAEALGGFHYEMVEACAFEDFRSRRRAAATYRWLAFRVLGHPPLALGIRPHQPAGQVFLFAARFGSARATSTAQKPGRIDRRGCRLTP
jgi:hypothetical protein